jgi:hypothetical protein
MAVRLSALRAGRPSESFVIESAFFLTSHYLCWLRHYATSRNVVVSIPDEVIGFFNLSNGSSRTMVPGLTHPLTELSIRNLLGGYRAAGA